MYCKKEQDHPFTHTSENQSVSRKTSTETVMSHDSQAADYPGSPHPTIWEETVVTRRRYLTSQAGPLNQTRSCYLNSLKSPRLHANRAYTETYTELYNWRRTNIPPQANTSLFGGVELTPNSANTFGSKTTLSAVWGVNASVPHRLSTTKHCQTHFYIIKAMRDGYYRECQ